MTRIDIPAKPGNEAVVSARNEAKQAVRQFDTALTALDDNWETLDADGQRQALRAMTPILARGLRWLMLRG